MYTWSTTGNVDSVSHTILCRIMCYARIPGSIVQHSAPTQDSHIAIVKNPGQFKTLLLDKFVIFLQYCAFRSCMLISVCGPTIHRASYVVFVWPSGPLDLFRLLTIGLAFVVNFHSNHSSLRTIHSVFCTWVWSYKFYLYLYQQISAKF